MSNPHAPNESAPHSESAALDAALSVLERHFLAAVAQEPLSAREDIEEYMSAATTVLRDQQTLALLGGLVLAMLLRQYAAAAESEVAIREAMGD